MVAAARRRNDAAILGETKPMKAMLCLMPLALLAACDSSPTVEAKNASVAEVAEKVREAGAGGDAYLRPGKWLSKATLEELSAPGMPAGMADQMKLAMAGKPGSESCMTKEDARKPNTDFFGAKSDQCRYDHFKMGDGKIDAKMRCSAGGSTQLMTMGGTYGPDQYEMRMTTQIEPGQAAATIGAMTMKMHVEGKRVGDCDGSEAAKS
jgi:hypothetical protein